MDQSNTNVMVMDYLRFKRMVTPVLIEIIFWLMTVIILLGAIVTMIGGVANGQWAMAFGGFVMLFLGPLGVRVYCELIIVIFRINETLVDIRDVQKPVNQPPAA